MDSIQQPGTEFKRCLQCPRNCGIDRSSQPDGYCRSDDGFNIAAIVIHHGEEPILSGNRGICNIFFTGCNLQCIHCQNYQISRNRHILAKKNGTSVIKVKSKYQDLDEIISVVKNFLDQGIKAIGFVSPSHMVPQVKSIIHALYKIGKRPITIYNTNAYEKPETIRELEGLIDVYLPDFKYLTPALAKEYSDAIDYPEFAILSIREMYRQKGSRLFTDDKGQAESGLIIRHLVLPGHTGESIKVLRYIAEEISAGIHLSLMSQYCPTEYISGHNKLGRSLYKEEYGKVVDELYRLGFRNGWIQELESRDIYKPDFSKEEPFR